MKVKKLNQIMKIPLLLGLFFFLPSMILFAQNDLEIATDGENGTSTTAFNFCCPGIKSETVATQPANTSRTKLGIGEKVMLSIEEEPSFSGTVTWEIVSGEGEISNNGNMATFTASDQAGETKIRAILEGTISCNRQIDFTIIAPIEIRFSCPPVIDRGCLHRLLHPSGGVRLRPYIFPDDVSFSNLEVQEQFVSSSEYTRTLYWSNQTPNDHMQGSYEGALDIVEPNLGTQVDAVDLIAIIGGLSSASGVGLLELGIPIKYRVGDTGPSFFMEFVSIQGIQSFQEGTLFGDEVFKAEYGKIYERVDDYFVDNETFFICEPEDEYQDCN